MIKKICGVIIPGIVVLLLMTLGYSQRDSAVSLSLDKKPFLRKLGEELISQEWDKRYRSLVELRRYGHDANDYFMIALNDKSDVISRTAQTYLIDQGESVVPFLVQKIKNIKEDRGLYARIAGGTERDRGKSVAGTLWLTFVRGMNRERCFEYLNKLISHPSPRIRSIVLFTAVSLRSEKFLQIVDRLRDDPDPLVQAKLREALVQLFMRDSPSTPELDAGTVQYGLKLLKPKIVSIFNSREPGFTEYDQTLAEMLGRDPLIHHRDKFISMLKDILFDPELTNEGALSVGRALVNQCELYELKELLAQWVSQMHSPNASEQLSNINLKIIASISVFPTKIFDREISATLIDQFLSFIQTDIKQSHRIPYIVAHVLQASLQESQIKQESSARKILFTLLGHKNIQIALNAGFACLELLRTESDKRPINQEIESIKEMVISQADRFFDISNDLSLRQMCRLIELFIVIDDPRYLRIFEKAWEYRYSDDLQSEYTLMECVHFLAEYDVKEIIPQLIAYVNEGAGDQYKHLKDRCLYLLTLRRFSAYASEFLTDSLFRRWMTLLQDPEQHPRFRAAFVSLVTNSALNGRQRKEMSNVLLKLSCAPNDANLRSKCLWRLGEIGDSRMIPLLYNFIMEKDNPYMVWDNCVVSLALFYGGPDVIAKKASPDKVRQLSRVLIDLLEVMLMTWGPEPNVEICHVNNYFNWAIQYRIYAPKILVDGLKYMTGNDFGYDVEKWRNWLEKL
jgi:hypothetical protein